MAKHNKSGIFAVVAVNAVYLFALYILQALIFTRLPIAGTKPLLFPTAVVGVALFGGTVRGGVFGLFAGILCDMSFNHPPIVFTIFLTLTGLIVGMLAERILMNGFPSFLFCSVIILLLTGFIQMFSQLFFYGAPFFALCKTAIFQMLYSLILIIPIYYASKSVGRLRRRQ